jgi:hypothetical protein
VTVSIDAPGDPGEAVVVDGVTANAVAEAIRDGHGRVTVTAPEPGPLFQHVGVVTDGMGVRVRTALARAGRSRGMTTGFDDELARARERLAAMTPEAEESTEARQRVATAGTDERRLRERVSELRGRLQAVREGGGDEAAVQASLADAVRELSEVETERIAAEQTLEAAEERARESRDRRERRFELEDRVANLERRARSRLVDRLRAEFAAALAAVPGEEATPPDPLDATGTTAALAVARVGDPTAPLVVDCERFDDAASAAAWLDAPVVYIA